MMLRTTAGSGAAVLALAGTLVLAACGSAPGSNPPAPAGLIRGDAAVEPAVSPRPFAAGDLSFGASLLSAWCRQQPDANLVLSPSSLATGLGLAYLGARGGTATSMAAVLHLPGGRSQLAGLQARARALRQLDGKGVTVADADRVWAGSALRPRRSYLNAAATGYDADLGLAPLGSDPAAAARQINAYIAAATRGHITSLLSADALADADFVLTDALYLKASWTTPFQAAAITTAPFVTAAGQQVQAKYLNGGQFTSVTSGGWTAVSLPYRGGRLNMTALLPPAAAVTPARQDGCPAISAAALSAMTRRLAAGRDTKTTAVSLPEANLSTKATLNGLLTKLGMGVAFGSGADFAGMSPQPQVIGAVVHAATLRVNARGTIASAATGVVMDPTAAVGQPLPVVTFSRPYLLLVSAAGSGEPLFLARVANPDLR
jgi:serpin B